MLPKHNRLQASWLIDKVRRKGQRFSCKYFRLFIQKRRTDSPNKIAVVISTKVSPKAVERNKLKRKTRAVFTKILPRLKPGYNFVLSYSKGAKKLKIQDIEKELINAFSKKKILKN